MDWSGFVPTLLATLGGAGIGVFGVYLAFRWESRRHRDTALTEALATVMREFAARNEALYAWMAQEAASTPTPPPPDLLLVAALEIAEMLATGKDFDFMKQVAITYLQIKNSHPARQTAANAIVVGTIGRWRGGWWDADKAQQSLDTAKSLASGSMRAAESVVPQG